LALVTAAPEQQVDTAAVLGRAREAVAAAWDYYRQQAAGSWAPRYLAGRGLDPTLAGYAPTGWTKLVGHLHGQGFTDLELLAAGLARTGNRAHRTGHRPGGFDPPGCPPAGAANRSTPTLPAPAG